MQWNQWSSLAVSNKMHSVKRTPFGISIALEDQSKTSICWWRNGDLWKELPSSIPWACNPMKSCEHFVTYLHRGEWKGGKKTQVLLSRPFGKQKLMRHTWCRVPLDHSVISILYTNNKFPSSCSKFSYSQLVMYSTILWDQGCGQLLNLNTCHKLHSL